MHGRVGRLKAIVAGCFAAAVLAPASAQAATADLAIAQEDAPDPVVRGAELTYTITVSNLGPEAAADVTVTGNLSKHVYFVSATPSQGSPCKRTGREIECELGMLEVGDATVTLRVVPRDSGTIINRASVRVAAPDTDPVAANNSDAETTTVIRDADDGGGGGGGGGGPTCSGQSVTDLGTAGADTIVGTSGRDVIKARAGDDVIRGLQGNDVVCAGGGNDTLKGAAGNDRLKGGSGSDLLRGAAGRDRLIGGPGRDVCKGGPGRDRKRSC